MRSPPTRSRGARTAQRAHPHLSPNAERNLRRQYYLRQYVALGSPAPSRPPPPPPGATETNPTGRRPSDTLGSRHRVTAGCQQHNKSMEPQGFPAGGVQNPARRGVPLVTAAPPIGRAISKSNLPRASRPNPLRMALVFCTCGSPVAHDSAEPSESVDSAYFSRSSLPAPFECVM